MALKGELMAGGLPATLANKLGFDPIASVAAAGTTIGTATALNANANNVSTVGVNAGVQVMRSNEWNIIMNTGANTLTVYPPTGLKFAGLSINVGFSLVINKSVFIVGDGTTLFYNLSA